MTTPIPTPRPDVIPRPDGPARGSPRRLLVATVAATTVALGLATGIGPLVGPVAAPFGVGSGAAAVMFAATDSSSCGASRN